MMRRILNYVDFYCVFFILFCWDVNLMVLLSKYNSIVILDTVFLSCIVDFNTENVNREIREITHEWHIHEE